MQTDEFLFIPKWLSQDLFIKLLRAGVGYGGDLENPASSAALLNNH